MVYRKRLAEGACDVYVPLHAVLATVSRDPQMGCIYSHDRGANVERMSLDRPRHFRRLRIWPRGTLTVNQTTIKPQLRPALERRKEWRP